MRSPFLNLQESEVRELCRLYIESLELWLRRFFDERATEVIGSCDPDSKIDDENFLFNSAVKNKVLSRNSNGIAGRRFVDELDFDDLIHSITKPTVWNKLTSVGLVNAFPDGCKTARTILSRLIDPRNSLSHARTISNRDAERVLCYVGDVLDSLKQYYSEKNMATDYNCPEIVEYRDSIGNCISRADFVTTPNGSILPLQKTNLEVRPGETVRMTLAVDAAFNPDDYTVSWSRPGSRLFATGHEVVIAFSEEHVAELHLITVTVKTQRNWHRYGSVDDRLQLQTRVLPPL